MPELDPFERSLEAAFRGFAERGVAPIDAVAFAERVAGPPRARGWTASLRPAPRLAWILLAAGLLLAALLAVAIGGGWRPDRGLVVVPSPMPTATAPGGILATTRARPLPAQATCPPGSEPDAPGDVDQDRPAGGAMAFDRRAGRIVLLEPGETGPTTWTYDVCANTWQRMTREAPPVYISPWIVMTRLVYDVDSDRTLAFTVNGSAQDGTGEIWSYDAATDRWSRMRTLSWMGRSAWASSTYGTIFYHDPSGLVVVFDGTRMWAYDVDTDTLTEVPQRPDPALPADEGLPQGMIAFGYDPVRDLVVAVVHDRTASSPRGGTADSPWPKPEASGTGATWTFDPGTGTWRKEASPAASDLIACGVLFSASRDCFATTGRAVFDEASGQTLFFDRNVEGYWSGDPPFAMRIESYDAGAGAWRTVEADPAAPDLCTSKPPVYDPLDRRVVCLAGGWEGTGVRAYSTITDEWRWLLEPASPSPGPTAAP